MSILVPLYRLGPPLYRLGPWLDRLGPPWTMLISAWTTLDLAPAALQHIPAAALLEAALESEASMRCEFVDSMAAEHHRGHFALVQVRGPGLSSLRPRFKFLSAPV